MKIANTINELRDNMLNCFQSKGQNMIEHGESVHDWYNKIITQIDSGTDELCLPAQITDIRKQIASDCGTIWKYHIYHDCGKPLCRTIDSDGRQHFPNHAEWSCTQFKHIFPNDHDAVELIRLDMAFHTLRGDDIIELWKHPLAPILYITAWAELFANATMFGGVESDSFKIKRKRLLKQLTKMPM